MGLNCGCPAGKHLNDLEIAECKESFGQIQKVIFARIFSSTGVKNKIPKETISKKATMTPLFAAGDGTKLIISPYIQNPTTEPGDARTFGGGNQTLGGIEITIGREPTAFSAIIYQESQKTIAQLKQYQCEEIGVYLIDENGNIGCLVDNQDEPTAYYPIPIGKFFVGDKKLGGFEEPDSNTIEWSFYPNWSDNFYIIKRDTMDFNPLTDWVNVASA